MSNDNKKGAQRAGEPAAAPVVPAADAAPVVGETEADKKAKEEAKKDSEAKRARDRRAKEKQDKEDKEAAEAEAEAKRGDFVGEGKSLTSKKGMVVAGDKVTAEHWDKETLEKLKVSGAVVTVK